MRLSWLFAPATDEVPRGQARAAVFLRLLLGTLWLYNVSWKRPPSFGKDGGSGLFKYTSDAVSHPVFPPYSWVVEHLVLPHFTAFGWLVLLAETALAVLLLSGAYVRLGALLGIAQSLAIGLSVAYAPNEWPWSYWLMIGGHVLLLFSSAGRYFAVDAVRAGLTSPRRLGQVWGGIAVVVGLVSALMSLSDPLAGKGSGLSSTDLSISAGPYNVLGGVVLAVVGVLILLGTRSPVLGLVGAGLGVVAALSLFVQVGFSSPLLGGNATSAAVYLTLAVVGLTVARLDRTRRAEPGPRVAASR